jgi:hypothetical protein
MKETKKEMRDNPGKKSSMGAPILVHSQLRGPYLLLVLPAVQNSSMRLMQVKLDHQQDED